MKTKQQHWIAVLLAVVALYYAVVGGLRSYVSLPVGEFTTFVTTACEEESLFALWKRAHGEAVYSDSSKVPFSQAYFNWFFYEAYGAVAKTMRAAGVRPEAWIVAYRLLTLAFALMAGLFASKMAGTKGWLATLSVAAIAGFHPIFNYWYVTTRPDMMALALEAAALAFFVSLARGREQPAKMAGYVLLAYLAWSAKHSSIIAMATGSTYFLLTKQYKRMAISCSAFAAMVLATLLVGGSLYRYALIYSHASSGYAIGHIVPGVVSTLVRAPHMGVALALAAMLFWQWMRMRRVEPVLFVLGIAFLASMGLAMAAFGKQGAGTNYFVPPVFFATVLLARRVLAPGEGGGHRWGLLFALATLFPLAYAPRTCSKLWLDGKGFHRFGSAYQDLGVELEGRPAPVLALVQGFAHIDGTGSLPWIQTHAPHFVLAYTYPFDRANGRQYEQGGIGGMIEAGTIQTIVLEHDKDLQSFDGADLSGYRMATSNEYWKILVRRQDDLNEGLATNAAPFQ